MSTLSEQSAEPLSVDPKPEERGGWRDFMARFQQPGQASFAGRYALVGVWVAVTAFFAIVEPGTLLTSGTFQTIFGSQQALVFLGMAAVVTFAVGEFDLSISAMMGLAATLVPVLVVQQGWSPAAACVAAVLAAMGVGALNGVIVVVLGIDAIITTLGMGTFILGITSGFSHSEAVSGLSNSFGNIANSVVLFGLPISFFYGLALALAIAYVMRFTALGRHMSFVGANREVARLAGVRVSRIRIGAYITSGLFCGLGGAYLSLDYVTLFSRGMTNERGLIALAAIFFARGRPFGTAAVAVLFGAATALAVRLPEMTGTAPQLLELVPYAVTLLALIAVGLRSLRSRGRYRTQHFDT